MYNKLWKLTDTTRKLYYNDKTTTPNAEIIDCAERYYKPKPTCISIKEDIRIENLRRIQKLKDMRELRKLWKI